MVNKVVTFEVNQEIYRKFSSLVKGQGKNYSEVLSEEIENCLKNKKVFLYKTDSGESVLRAVHIPKDLWVKYSVFLLREGKTKADQIRGIIKEYVGRDENAVSGENTTC